MLQRLQAGGSNIRRPQAEQASAVRTRLLQDPALRAEFDALQAMDAVLLSSADLDVATETLMHRLARLLPVEYRGVYTDAVQ